MKSASVAVVCCNLRSWVRLSHSRLNLNLCLFLCVSSPTSIHCVTSHWSSWQIQERVAPYSTWPAMTSSSWKLFNTKRLSFYRNSFLDIIWWVKLSSSLMRISCIAIFHYNTYRHLRTNIYNMKNINRKKKTWDKYSKCLISTKWPL